MAEEGYDGTERVFTAGGRHYGIIDDIANYTIEKLGGGTVGALNTSDVVTDSAGLVFNPAACSHVYGYDGSGDLTTDTATDPVTSFVRVKTFTYSAGELMNESLWVKQ